MAKKLKNRHISDEEFAEDYKEMERLIKKLRAEYNQFFSGALKHIPFFNEQQLRRLFKKYRGGDLIRKPVDRYRFFNMQAKFNANMELWMRKKKAKEGQAVFGRQNFAAAPIGGAHSENSRDTSLTHVPGKGMQYSVVTRNPAKESSSIDRLFKSYREANQLIGKDVSKISRDKFQKYLEKQVNAVQQKHQCDAVKFTLQVDGGALKMKAKGVKAN